MSRKAPISSISGSSTPLSRRSDTEDGEHPLSTQFSQLVVSPSADSSETCPICKSSRYLNPEMKFYVNPECYHKMCGSCVDRIFSQGPAPCPAAGCHRTLRKQRFRIKTFDDVKMEHEVDVRRRLAKVFNKQEANFDTLLDYNNYLEEVETLTYNLLNGIDVENANKKIRSYQAANADSIAQNASKQSQASASFEARQAAAREEARLRREQARKEDDEQRREVEIAKRELIAKLASGGGDPGAIAEEAKRIAQKRTAARRRLESSSKTTASNNESFVIKGLKPATVRPPSPPYSPFGGMAPSHIYFSQRNNYENSFLDALGKDPSKSAGGYDVEEYYSRTLLEAFAGLGVFLEEEVAKRDTAADKSIGSESAAAVAVGDIQMEGA
ncbi:MAG: TFIIH/NER complex subunit [Cirrosporium novae-zelandiae]|nr:MAG: TFIIH/NER complex subunit [Cirrosporium novae-zelandiae]